MNNFRLRSMFLRSLPFLCIIGIPVTAFSAEKEAVNGTSDLKVPPSIQNQHKDLHARLAAAEHLAGATGEAARRLAGALEGHFEKEERWALPILSLLPDLSHGEMPLHAGDAQQLSSILRKEEAQMLLEHKEIKKILSQLRTAASSEGRKEVVVFCDDLARHAKSEEEIFYPAALLVGDYIRLKQDLAAHRAKNIAR